MIVASVASVRLVVSHDLHCAADMLECSGERDNAAQTQNTHSCSVDHDPACIFCPANNQLAPRCVRRCEYGGKLNQGPVRMLAMDLILRTMDTHAGLTRMQLRAFQENSKTRLRRYTIERNPHTPTNPHLPTHTQQKSSPQSCTDRAPKTALAQT